MSSDREATDALNAARVPQYVWPSTLHKLGEDTLASWVEQGEYTVEGTPAMENTLFFPESTSQAAYARKVTYLAAKELTLLSESVYVVSLGTLISYLEGKVPEKVQEGIRNSVFLFVMDIFENGADFPLAGNPRLAFTLREFIKDRMQKTQQCLVMYGDKLSGKDTRWWPESFLQELVVGCSVVGLSEISKRSKVVPIKPKGRK